MSDLTGDAVELLQALIRNACVNDGTVSSGQEGRSADLLQHFLEGSGIDVERFESEPGRASLVARIDGIDPEAPTLCLMGHTDVVPVNSATWDEDPFGGEVIDGEIWGRGAIDMLNITATMAVTVRELARSGYRPRGSLVYFAVADEEAGGHYGAEYMVNHHWDAVACDYLLTEIGGWSRLAPDGTRRVSVMVGEKGLAWRRLRIVGTPGHGSMPYGADNALVTTAEVVRRLVEYRPAPYIDELWSAQVQSMNLPEELRAALVDPARIDGALAQLPLRVAAACHAQTHTTFSPNVAHGGSKTNVIPDEVLLDVDVRTVPGETAAEVDAHLAAALGELAVKVEISAMFDEPSTRSPTDNPLWGAVGAAVRAAYPEAVLEPGLLVGGTDARYFRRRGTVALGTALYSPGVSAETFTGRFHGNNERIDVDSLGYSNELWRSVVRQLLD